jgi:ABC-type Na+ transport system ATPase subunit NatA
VPYEVNIKLKGNSITQKYYTKQLLPGLIATLYKHYNNPEYLEYKNCILQEDNNGLYGTRSKVNIAQKIKEKVYIKVLNHPLQSLDLNPIKGIWNIFKQHIRKCYYK